VHHAAAADHAAVMQLVQPQTQGIVAAHGAVEPSGCHRTAAASAQLLAEKAASCNTEV
jgi:hypothetical protein